MKHPGGNKTLSLSDRPFFAAATSNKFRKGQRNRLSAAKWKHMKKVWGDGRTIYWRVLGRTGPTSAPILSDRDSTFQIVP